MDHEKVYTDYRAAISTVNYWMIRKVARRRRSLALLVHVAIPADNAESIQAVFEQCCRGAGDIVIGRRLYEDVGELLLVVLLEQEIHIDKHVPILVQALQQRIILSYQFEYAQLVTLRCNEASDNIRDIMRDFPLQSNESWFPAINDAHIVYLCIRSLSMLPDQESWLHEHKIEYQHN